MSVKIISIEQEPMKKLGMSLEYFYELGLILDDDYKGITAKLEGKENGLGKFMLPLFEIEFDFNDEQTTRLTVLNFLIKNNLIKQ